VKTKYFSRHLRKIFTLSLLIFPILLSVGPVGAGFWDNDPQKISLDDAVISLSENLADDGCPYDLKVSEPFGRDQVLVIASEKSLPLPKFDSPLWQQAEALLNTLRNQMLRKNCGYAEAKIELITEAR
jgi:hypothetical protein